MKKINWLVFTFLAFTILACNDDDSTLDTENPTITITAPTSGQQLNNDEQLQVRATVRDNLGLDEVTIWVTPPNGQAQQVYSEPVSDFLNDSREATIEENINLGTGPVSPGNYIVTVRAVDDRENMAEESVTVSVREADPNAPTIAITSPEDNATYELGSDMIISALVQEDMNLSSIDVNASTGNEEPLVDMNIADFDENGSHQIQDTVTIPANAAVGTYTLTITATDLAGNETVQTRTFSVTEADARMATFTITGLPENTPEGENLYISGEFADGIDVEPGTNDAFLLNDNGDGTYSTTLPLADSYDADPTPGVHTYRIYRQGGWDTGATTADCTPETRELAAGSSEATEFTVENWEDLCQ